MCAQVVFKSPVQSSLLPNLEGNWTELVFGQLIFEATGLKTAKDWLQLVSMATGPRLVMTGQD